MLTVDLLLIQEKYQQTELYMNKAQEITENTPNPYLITRISEENEKIKQKFLRSQELIKNNMPIAERVLQAELDDYAEKARLVEREMNLLGNRVA